MKNAAKPKTSTGLATQQTHTRFLRPGYGDLEEEQILSLIFYFILNFLNAGTISDAFVCKRRVFPPDTTTDVAAFLCGPDQSFLTYIVGIPSPCVKHAAYFSPTFIGRLVMPLPPAFTIGAGTDVGFWAKGSGKI
jgi:hypothetical protein